METWWNWISGNLSDPQRVWSAIAPGLLGLLWVLAGYAVYSVRNWRNGPYRDREMEARGETLLLGMRLRQFFSWLMAPVWKSLLRAGVPANAVTLLSALLAVGAGVAVAFGRFSLGGWLYLATGLCDYFDGRIARESGSAGPRGAVLDSVIDRYVEGAFLVGLTWFYRDSPWAVVGLLALTGSFLVPYVRARGEGAGATFNNVGFMQRPERVVLVGITAALAPAFDVLFAPSGWPAHALTLGGLAIVAVAAHATAVQRLLHIMRTLPGGGPLPTERFREVLTSAAGLATELVVLAGFFYLHTHPVLATFIACTLGAGVAVALTSRDGFRVGFLAVSTGALTAGGVALFLETGALGPIAAWLVARVGVAVTWERPAAAPALAPHAGEGT